MTKHKHSKAFTSLLREIFQLQKTVKPNDVQWWLRFLLVNSRRQFQSGFVLPTTVMVILVAVLTVTAIVFRTFSRTNQVIGQRQQQVVYNSATPAIDRAKAKLEYLFREDKSLPAGVPSDSTIEERLEKKTNADDEKKYTLPDEKRLDFKDANGNPGIGWYFQKDGKTIAYSIIFRKQVTDSTGKTTIASLRDNADKKAKYLVVRNGPVNTSKSSAGACGGDIQLASNERQWEPINSATLAKTFQVTALVVDSNNSTNRKITTLEFQQDRQADKGNKWGAYFRYDLELFPGVDFNWNGAMHSDGNIFINPGAGLKAHLISSPSSCVNNSPGASKITVSKYTDENDDVTFEGQIIAGDLKFNQFSGNSKIDLFEGEGLPPTENKLLDFNNSNPQDSSHSVNVPKNGVPRPADFALDPIELFTKSRFLARGANKANTQYNNPKWEDSDFNQKRRIFKEETPVPYLDDTYRADDRYGPNPTYDGKSILESSVQIPAGKKVGDTITAADPNKDRLTRNTPPDPRSPEDLGLDGYWERRASSGGLRIIVGQRLELLPLGNPVSPVMPAGISREHEFLQRRTQKNNVAAVQATAVYHYNTNNGTAPVACMATTVHPGTAETLKRSATFEFININGVDRLNTDFVSGRGTNGWEFAPVGAPSPTMLAALNNLAQASGDPDGAFPPTQPAAASSVRPALALTQFGDFSNLRRALRGGAYASLSVADKSYIDTASCTLGILAYNLDNLADYNYINASNTAQLTALNNALASLNLNDIQPNNGEITVNAAQNTVTIQPVQTAGSPVPAITLPLPPGVVDANGYITYVRENANRPDAGPEAYIALLPENVKATARLIVAKEQVELDRRNGVSYTCDGNKFGIVDGAPRFPQLDKLCPPKQAGVAYGSSHVKNQALARVFPLHATPTYTIGPTIFTSIDNIALNSIALQPTDVALWRTPKRDVTASVAASPNLPNSTATNLNNLIRYQPAAAGSPVQYHQIAFKDAAFFNGREMMSIRSLDIDLNLLRTTDAPGGDKWLPINDKTASDPNAPPPSGIVYAFREDAVREDGIARTPGAAMNARPGSLSDPTIAADNGITTKPVDYYPDPERRPYGFRLKNGARLDRGVNTAGMSFVSDNPVYIQGDFNLHSTDGTSENLQEFIQQLNASWTDFYKRDIKETRFAKPATDYWRPTEVLGDSVTILSSNFCDGSIEDGMVFAGTKPEVVSTPPLRLDTQYGCNNAALYTSYVNQNRPIVRLSDMPGNPNGSNDRGAWVRENPFDINSPISINASGVPSYYQRNAANSLSTTEYQLASRPAGANPPQNYLRFADQDQPCDVRDNRKCIGTASNTTVNSIIVQGIIPSRAEQSYGGFHNFPRLLENWKNNRSGPNSTVNLRMAGSFVQLRFSTQATGLSDQDAWEPGQVPTSTEPAWYFLPPQRLWGYDVALQYQTAGPVSRRFSTPGTTRSEVYRELAIDDPYVLKLRCAKDESGKRIDSKASCS